MKALVYHGPGQRGSDRQAVGNGHIAASVVAGAV
jgi:hypothetical protein